MEGVTAAIVAFCFVCVVFPNIVKKKPQFYLALVCIVLVIFLTGLNRIMSSQGAIGVSYFIICILQVIAILLLILGAGGLTFKQLVGEVNEAIESVRKDAGGGAGAPKAEEKDETKMTG
jgi:hypothetical protein